MTRQKLKLGIVSALAEEQHGLIDVMLNKTQIIRGQRTYTSGSLWGIDVVCVLSRIGKVAAAASTVTLIEHFGVTHLLFTGVAGSAVESLAIGDIVVAEELVQHDMDSSPLFPKYEIPMTGLSHFKTDRHLTTILQQAVEIFFKEDFLNAIHLKHRQDFALTRPNQHHGLIASGDEFITSAKRMNQIKQGLPATLAVEMEGAAVAQVCVEFGLPFAVMRTISDSANESTPVDFANFIETVASYYAFHIVKRTCMALN